MPFDWLFQIDWNQDKWNRWSKEIELRCYVHYIYKYVYHEDRYYRLISINPDFYTVQLVPLQ